MNTVASTDSAQLSEAFARDGYIVVPGVYTAAEVAAFKEETRRLLGLLETNPDSLPHRFGATSEGVARTGVFVGLAANSEVFRQAARAPRLLDALEAILGPNIEFLSDKIVYKSSETDYGSPWHQDWTYWHGTHKISAWVALDPATRENGCLKLLPGSHREAVVHDGDASDGKGFGNRLDPNAVDESQAVAAPVQPGDAILFHDLTLHASYPNTTGKDRWSLISTFRAVTDEDPPYSWAVAAEVVRGTGKG
jgi:ectoine hydroxylase-related dioxygenase (phytanoyl-CoA dioxygenase family)